MTTDLDNEEINIEQYSINLRNKIASNINFVDISGSGNCILSFTIYQNGTLGDTNIEFTNNDNLSGNVLKALSKEQVYSQLPQGYQKVNFEIKVLFYNNEFEVKIEIERIFKMNDDKINSINRAIIISSFIIAIALVISISIIGESLENIAVTQTNKDRYKIVTNPHRVDMTFLLDTKTGKTWNSVVDKNGHKEWEQSNFDYYLTIYPMDEESHKQFSPAGMEVDAYPANLDAYERKQSDIHYNTVLNLLKDIEKDKKSGKKINKTYEDILRYGLIPSIDTEKYAK